MFLSYIYKTHGKILLCIYFFIYSLEAIIIKDICPTSPPIYAPLYSDALQRNRMFHLALILPNLYKSCLLHKTFCATHSWLFITIGHVHKYFVLKMVQANNKFEAAKFNGYFSRTYNLKGHFIKQKR